MQQIIPNSENWNWARIRELAQKMAQTEGGKDLAAVAGHVLGASDAKDRLLAVYLLGFTSAEHPERLEILRRRVPADPSWEVQEALAQAFDAYCAAIGYEAALPTIDAWLADPQPNARRAVSEGLRPWTSKRRAYFAAQPAEAIRRLAALRADPSDYVRHSAGNALRDIRRAHAALVDAETATWNLDDPLEAFTYKRVLKAQ
ncbi:MAG TPA: DNA alkylation repair protein [Ktedonobacterales bacterium]|nr:DNA alkylation repair protein [Ktedonobacterales bacterium]